MFEKARSGRDAFTFSRKGLTAKAPFVIPAVVADDRINEAWARRLGGAEKTQGPGWIERFENLLGRYFAPGGCNDGMCCRNDV